MIDNDRKRTSAPSPRSDAGPKVRERVEALIQEWAPLLNLDGWAIYPNYDEATDQANAEAEPRYRTLRLAFNPQRFPEDEYEQEELVLHELCHAFTWRIWQFAEQIVAANYGSSTHKVWEWLLEEIHEEAVSEIAYALLRTKFGSKTRNP